jgi:hypothetical protein
MQTFDLFSVAINKAADNLPAIGTTQADLYDGHPTHLAAIAVSAMRMVPMAERPALICWLSKMRPGNIVSIGRQALWSEVAALAAISDPTTAKNTLWSLIDRLEADGDAVVGLLYLGAR